MSTETKRQAWVNAYNDHGMSIAVDALEALMREVADERIAAHRSVPEPERAKSASDLNSLRAHLHRAESDAVAAERAKVNAEWHASWPDTNDAPETAAQQKALLEWWPKKEVDEAVRKARVEEAGHCAMFSRRMLQAATETGAHEERLKALRQMANEFDQRADRIERDQPAAAELCPDDRCERNGGAHPHPEAEPAKCADCSPGCDGGAERRWHTSGSGPCSGCGCHAYRAVQAKCVTCGGYGGLAHSSRDDCPECGRLASQCDPTSKATPPSAKGPPETIWIFQVADGKHPKAWWQVIEGGTAGRDEGDIQYTRSDLVAAKVAKATHSGSLNACREARDILDAGAQEYLDDASLRVVARVAELEANVERLLRQAKDAIYAQQQAEADRDGERATAIRNVDRAEAAEKRVKELEAEVEDAHRVAAKRQDDMVKAYCAELAEVRAKLVAMQEWAGKVPAIVLVKP